MVTTKSINQKPGVWKRAVRYIYNPIFETFLVQLQEAGFGVRSATSDELGGRSIYDDSIHMETKQIVLAHSGEGPVMTKVVRTWCGMAIFDHEIDTEGDEWDKIQAIWEGL